MTGDVASCQAIRLLDGVVTGFWTPFLQKAAMADAGIGAANTKPCIRSAQW
ncbi:hypothetical protein D3C71_2040540 [compost metagenome]